MDEETAERLADALQKLASEAKTANLIAYAAMLDKRVEDQTPPDGGTTSGLQQDRELLATVTGQIRTRLMGLRPPRL